MGSVCLSTRQPRQAAADAALVKQPCQVRVVPMDRLASCGPHPAQRLLLMQITRGSHAISDTAQLCCACTCMHNSTCQAGRLAKAPNLCDVSCSAGIWSLSRSFRLRAVDDDTVQQQAPAAEAGAELLDLPFESDMKSFTGGSTGSITPAAAAGTMLGPSRLSLEKPSAWSSFGTCMLSSLHHMQVLLPCMNPNSTQVMSTICKCRLVSTYS
jgi:hypothetical protein